MFNKQQLPAGLPGEFTVELQEGTHRGARQLWAPVSHDGHSYRLVMSGQIPGVRVTPQAGETWTVWPDHSPNGHVVFCSPHRMVKDVNGMHPLVASLQTYASDTYCVVVMNERHPHNVRSGTLKSVSMEGDGLKLNITNARLDLGGRPIPDFQLVCPIDRSHENRRTKSPFKLQVHAEAGSYSVTVNRN